MNYDFDRIVDRTGTWSEKWNIKKGELPMWVADMDFKVAPEIQEAIQKRTEHGVFGYSAIPREWSEAYISWWDKRHGYLMKREWIWFCSGVISATASIIRTLTNPDDGIIIQPPVYHVFYNIILQNNRRVLENTLILKDGYYTIDFDDLEKKMSDEKTTLMIISNPQNPSGRLWKKEELKRIGELAKKYNITVVSDEIHCDITDPGYSYVPFASASDECQDACITCLSPSKAFNVPGLQTAAVSIANPGIRKKVLRGLIRDNCFDPGAFSIDSAIAAFTKGEAWLDALREYIYTNKECLKKFIKEEISDVELVQDHSTYLCWLDCRKITDDDSLLVESIRKKTGLVLSAGSTFGEAGKGFLRINVACPRKMLYDGLERLKRGMNIGDGVPGSKM